MNYMTKKDGFKNENSIILPLAIQEQIAEDPLTGALYTTDIGYFPYAKCHYRARPEGSPNNILLFCVDGSGTVEIENTAISLSKNHLIIIPANQAHSYYANTNEPWSIYWLHYNGQQAERYTQLLAPRVASININTDQHSELIQIFTSIFIQLELGYSMDVLLHVTSLLHLFFSSIKKTSTQSSSRQENTSHYINDLITYMQKHINQSLSLSVLASTLNISSSHLTHYFKEKTGYAPIDYFIHMKMQKACHRLDTSNDSIKEIAQSLGYNDPYYFSRIFKKTMSLSPRAYRHIEKG